MKKLNNKGFTLVEVLAVLVILTVIMGIAIPSISSSLERSKSKQDTARLEVLYAYAELFVTDNKNTIVDNLTDNKCYIVLLDDLVNNGYASQTEIEDSDGYEFAGVIIYNHSTNDFDYTEDEGDYEEISSCITQ